MNTEDPRSNFDQVTQEFFNSKNPVSKELLAYVQRLLYQFRISNKYEAKDILIEVYIRGIKQTEAGKSIDIPIAWIKRASLNVIRERRRELDKFEEWNVEQEPYLEGTDSISEEKCLEALQKMRIAFKRLEPEERQILHLRVVKKMPWKDVSHCLVQSGSAVCSENLLRQRGSRALKKLKKIYEEEQKNSLD